MRCLLTPLLWLCVSAVSGAALPGPRPVWPWWPEDAKIPIEWKATWDETVDVNYKRWDKELTSARSTDRERRRSLRMVRLYEQLLARHGKDPEKRILAIQGIADSYRRAYYTGRACYYLRKLAEDFPGRTDVAVRALHTLLSYISWDSPHDMAEGAAWLEYATVRLLALRDAGALAENHPASVDALRAWVVLCRFRRDLVGADEAVSRLERITGNNMNTQMDRADLLFAADRYFDAHALYESIHERTDDSRAQSRLYQMREEAPISPPTFPGKFGIEMRWESAQDDRLELMLPWVDRLIRDDSTGSSLTAWGKERHTSIWYAVDRHLRAQDPAKLTGLRTAQDAAARAELPSARRAGDVGLVAFFRQFPWAAASHGALVELGEREVRRGHGGLAAPSFQDVLDHAVDPALRARAQAGLWLALAQAGNGPALGRALDGAGGRRVPWLGAQADATAIRPRLGAAPSTPPGPGPPLGKLGRRVLKLPDRTPWPHRLLWAGSQRWFAWAFSVSTSLVSCEGGALACGPALFAWYPDGADRPAWVRRATRLQALQGKVSSASPQYVTVPGPFRPARVGDTIYTRWGLDPRGRVLAGVAAMELRTGRMRWSTLGDPAWEGLWPVSDPAAADGRLYLLAIRRGRHQVLPLVPVFLVCLDASSGELMWKQHLASQALGLLLSTESGYPRKAVDVVHYGNAVTVHDGAVLCSTNAGFVARCDARDGAIEWVRSYARTRPRHDVPDFARRHGASPVVADGKAVFVPRDRLGIFALDAATGAPVWDNVYVPSHGVAGRLGGLLVTYDSRHAAALDVASGAVRWHRRFDAALAAAPRMVGTTLLVGLPTGLVSLDARTGRRLAEVPWGSQGAMGAFVVRDGHIVGTSTEPVGFESADVGRPLAKGAPSADGGLALPMAQVWRLPRSGPRLLETPQELDGNLYLLSEGMLECVEATERGGVRWRRAVPLGAGRVRWAQGRLVLTFPGRAFAIDGKTGKLLWETALPFHVRKVVLAPPHLFLGSWDAARRHWRMASLDLATGALEWENDLRELVRHGNDGVREAVWDGGDKMILFARLTYGKAAHYTLPVSLKDGRLLGMKKFRDGEKWMRLFVGDKTGGFYVDDHKQGWAFTLDGGVKHVRYKANFGKIYDRPTSLRGSFDGPWLHINQQIAYPDSRTHWVLKRGDPAYELIRPQFGTSRGARLYEADGQTLVMTDLASRKELARYTVGGGRGRKVDILGHHAAKGRLLVVSGVYGGKAWDPEPRGLRLDLFEEGTGRLLAGQTLEGPAYWNLAHSYAYDYREDERSQVVFRKGVLYLTDMHGLQAYAPEPAAQRVDTPRPLVYRAEKSPVLDGSLAEWGGAETVSLRGPAGQKGTLKLTHDDRSLFLGVTCPDRDPRPRVGRGDHGGGDWLEVALTTRDSSHRWGLGLDAKVQPVWESLGGNGVLERLGGGVRHDAARGETVYELAIPLDAIVRRSSSWQRMGLSLAVWDETARHGPQRALTWGGAIEGRLLLPGRHEELYVHSATAESEAAAVAIVRALPEYDIGWKLFVDACRRRARRPYSRVVIPPFVELLKHLRDGPAAERALVTLDHLLRSSPEDDPSAEILRLAEKAGVSAAVRQRYARLTRSRLSQWVYLDPKKPPKSFMIRLASQHGDVGWDHRVYWGHSEWSSQGAPHTPSRRHAPALPEPGKWRELRIPLIWLGIHDRPIHGISYWTDGGRMVWDRTAVQYDGGERVIVDDKLPKGDAGSGWQWVSTPRKTGSRAHTRGADSSRVQIRSLEEPVYEHLTPPLPGPYISQWVYLDPKQPPKFLTLCAYHRSAVEHRVVWGKPIDKQLYAGPLPPLGRWHELRIPLSGTRLASASIDGVEFGHDGGKVVWDRTAVVAAGGREQVVIDDDAPVGSKAGDWQWVEDPVRSGKKAHTQPVRAGYHTHRQLHWRDHVTLHMPSSREQKMAVLKENLPKLGATESAYAVFALLLRAGEGTREKYVDVYRWFVTTFPNHKRTADMLVRIYAYYREERPETADKVMADLLREAGIPRATRYAFNVGNGANGPAGLRNWRIIGPFPNPGGKGHERAYPPETEAVGLTRSYEGAAGPVRWKLLHANTDILDLDPRFTPNEHVVAYAVCWVKMDRGRFVSLEVGSDDGCKLWVNDRVVLDRNVLRSLAPRSDRVRAYLKTGWNRILIKVVQTTADWDFIVELFDTEGRSLLPNTRITTTPPRQ